ncbi:alpha/beta hydrolase family esterase [Cryptosporangium japonicum]|uniref:PHB depolymerase family esterase n=1 Tax=Cryptosporangium japonicum TaxID=80872 RepID=A0ABN0V5P0_9ACTN
MRKLLLVVLVMLAGCSRADSDVHTLGDRTYRVHGTGDTVVIVLHGGGGNGAQVAEQTGFDALADREGFRAVYPDGSGRSNLLTWNAGTCCAYARDQGVDDVGFIRALIDELDADRVFVTGFSNGAMLTYRLGCELADRITAIAPVSGALDVPSCTPSRPLPVYVIHGDADEVVPYAGGVSTRRPANEERAGSHPPVSFAVKTWVGVDRCSGTPTRTVSGVVTSERYDSCAPGVQVWLDTIAGGEHAWPGGAAGRRGADQPADFDASAAIWGFFATHGG